MPSKNKVNVTVSNADNLKGTFTGGNIGSGHKSDEDVANEVNANLQDIKNSQLEISGGDISISGQSLEPLLKELVEILAIRLPEKGQKQDLQELADEVLEQANKPSEEKNIPKIQRLLKGLSGYVGIVTLAVTQAERIKVLFGSIQKIILGY